MKFISRRKTKYRSIDMAYFIVEKQTLLFITCVLTTHKKDIFAALKYDQERKLIKWREHT